MARLNPYLQFNGNCREAMGFYQACLGGDLIVNTFGESPAADQVPAEIHDQVLHSMLTNEAVVLMATDAIPGGPPSQGGPVTLALTSDDKEEIRALFAKLAVDGTITQPLQEVFFGLFGVLTDQYGINWMFQGGPVPAA